MTAGIARLEEMTRRVSLLGLFSRNEDIKEVHTALLKYLLLPALLGDLSLRSLAYERYEMLTHAETYFRDFIGRLNDYGVCDLPHLARTSTKDEEEDKIEEGKGKLKRDPLVSSAIFRDTKINRYKEGRRLQEALSSLKQLMLENEHSAGGSAPAKIDEDVERRFYLTLITQWLGRAVDELESIELEKPMAKMRMSEALSNSSKTSKPSKPKGKPKPPMIITRDAAQKAVFGLGYPSYPTVTVDEFIGAKKDDGSLAFKDTRVYGNSLYDWANDPEKKAKEDESEEERKERLVEADDSIELARSRAMDDWKDDHRRGEGNRHNMG